MSTPHPKIEYERARAFLDETGGDPITPENARLLGDLATRLFTRDISVTGTGGRPAVETRYYVNGTVIAPDGSSSTATFRIATGLAKEFEDYGQTRDAVHTDYADMISGAPGVGPGLPDVESALDAWSRIDRTKSKRHELEDKIARRDVLRAITSARDSGAISHAQALAMAEKLDDLRREVGERIEATRIADEETAKTTRETRPYSFEDYLDEVFYQGPFDEKRQFVTGPNKEWIHEGEDEKRWLLEGRHELAKQLGLLRDVDPTIGDNHHQDTAETLLDEASWNRVLESAGNIYSEYLLNNSDHLSNPVDTLRGRFVILLKMEAEGGIDVSNLQDITTFIDDDVEWDILLDDYAQRFANYVDDEQTDDIFGQRIHALFSKYHANTADELSYRYKTRLIDEYDKILDDGSILDIRTASYEHSALDIMDSLARVTRADFELPNNVPSPAGRGGRLSIREYWKKMGAEKRLRKGVRSVDRDKKRSEKDFLSTRKRELKEFKRESARRRIS